MRPKPHFPVNRRPAGIRTLLNPGLYPRRRRRLETFRHAQPGNRTSPRGTLEAARRGQGPPGLRPQPGRRDRDRSDDGACGLLGRRRHLRAARRRALPLCRGGRDRPVVEGPALPDADVHLGLVHAQRPDRGDRGHLRRPAHPPRRLSPDLRQKPDHGAGADVRAARRPRRLLARPAPLLRARGSRPSSCWRRPSDRRSRDARRLDEMSTAPAQMPPDAAGQAMGTIGPSDALRAASGSGSLRSPI